MSSSGFSIRHYMRDMELPFCAGCGDVTIINCFLRVIHDLGYRDLGDFVFCSGIGCAAWIPSPYFKADSIHVTHGRSIPVAMGIKLVRPELNVVVFGGDGDLTGIGLSHLIHAARRNLDVTVIMANNMIYGMTGAQVAPTTPLATKTATTPYGSFEYPIDVAHLVAEAGACYSARWTTHHVKSLRKSMRKALETEGFAFVEVVSQCPIAYGRAVGMPTAREMLQHFRKNSITLEKSKEMSEEELKGKILVGEYVNRKYPSLTERFRQMKEEAMRNAKREN